jgi:large subunit ribosomal protein L29
MRWLEQQADFGELSRVVGRRQQADMKAKLKELRDRSVEDLQREVVEKQKHLFDLRSQAVTEKLEDPSQLKKTRKHIARIKTILRERQHTATVAK